MGNSNNQSQTKEWKVIQVNKNNKILRNDKTGELIEEYITYSLEDELKQIIDCYDLRKTSPQNIVSILIYRIQQTKFNCSTQPIIYVYTQHFPYHINQIHDLTIKQAIYIIINCLKGMINLKNKNGSFFILDDYSINIDSKGNIKIWINQNLAKNVPQKIYPKLYKEEQEHIMVRSIFLTIQSHLQTRKFPFQFQHYLNDYMKQPYKLQQSLNLIKSYALKNNIELSNQKFLTFLQNRQNKKHEYNINSKQIITPQSIRLKNLNTNDLSQEQKIESKYSFSSLDSIIKKNKLYQNINEDTIVSKINKKYQINNSLPMKIIQCQKQQSLTKKKSMEIQPKMKKINVSNLILNPKKYRLYEKNNLFNKIYNSGIKYNQQQEESITPKNSINKNILSQSDQRSSSFNSSYLSHVNYVQQINTDISEIIAMNSVLLKYINNYWQDINGINNILIEYYIECNCLLDKRNLNSLSMNLRSLQNLIRKIRENQQSNQIKNYIIIKITYKLISKITSTQYVLQYEIE